MGIVETNLDFPEFIPTYDQQGYEDTRDYFNVTVLMRTEWVGLLSCFVYEITITIHHIGYYV